MSQNFDLNTLRAFTLIAHGRTFGEVADLIGRTQSAVSLQMQRLEADVGAHLFRRSRLGAELTEAGHRLLDYAGRLIEMNDDALETMSRANAREITLGVATDLAETILPLVVERFRKEHFEWQLTLRIDETDALIEAAAQGELELAIGCDRDHPLKRGSVGDARMIWIGSPDFRLPKDDALPIALFAPPCAFRAAALEALGENRPHRIVATSDSLAGIAAAVHMGRCVTVRTPLLLSDKAVDIAGAFDLPPLSSVTFSYYARARQIDAARAALLDICRRCLEEQTRLLEQRRALRCPRVMPHLV